MKLFITKASNDNYSDISNMYDIPTLYKKYGKFIIEKNSWKDREIETIIRYWKVSIKKAKEISNCDFRLIIYDYWVE